MAGLAVPTWKVVLMPDPDRMVVTTTALPRLFRSLGSGCFLLVKPHGFRASAPSEVVEQVSACVEAANASVPPRTIVGGFCAGTKKGIAFSVYVSGSPFGIEDAAVPDATRHWLDVLITELEERGIVGSLAPSGRGLKTDPLIFANEKEGRGFPAAFMAYRLDTYPPRGQRLNNWLVGETSTDRIAARLQEWVATPGLDAWVRLPHGQVSVDPNRISDFLSFSSRHSGYGRYVTVADEEPTLLRKISLCPLGTCVTQLVDFTLGWREQLDTQIEALLLDPELADVGLIKNIGVGASNWANLKVHGDTARGHRGHIPELHPLDYENSRHLWDEYVIDAAGVNLLTSKHLEHANDLSNWTVEQVAPDRFLITAQDLEAWYANYVPSPEIITRARTDFGDMILTWDVIVAKPGPYTVTGDIVGR